MRDCADDNEADLSQSSIPLSIAEDAARDHSNRLFGGIIDKQLQRLVELQVVPTGITKVKLPRAPRRVLRRGPGATLACI